FLDFMIPIVQGWCTETAQEVTSLGVQVHGGMGYIEETGAAQYYRDARIITIYEGTTGIQANDLVGRKTLRDDGAAARGVAAQAEEVARACAAHADPSLAAIGRALADAVGALNDAIAWVVVEGGTSPATAYAGAVPYLKLCGTVTGGWQMARAAQIARWHLDAGTGDFAFHAAKIATARFYAGTVLPQAQAQWRAMTGGSAAALTLPPERF
ncbi:MAG: acyl-CoA dehydrogenase, partial [Casimicrobiaceae bacterium]